MQINYFLGKQINYLHKNRVGGRNILIEQRKRLLCEVNGE
jgi:hypothetical protein